MKNNFILIIILGLASCSVPKAIVIMEAPPEKKATVTPLVQHAPVTIASDKDLRIGEDILALPNDEQLRPSSVTSSDGEATKITRPPAE